MTEKDLLEKIKSSAQEIEVPESLSPENIKEKLDTVGAFHSESKQEEVSTEIEPVFQKKRHWYNGRKMVAAAAVLLVCGIGATAYQRFWDGGLESETEGDTDKQERWGKSDAGDVYILAENYGELYDMLIEQAKPIQELRAETDIKASSAEYAVLEDAKEESFDVTTGTNRTSFSKTNIQTEGVDESDIIKTDGEYLYIVDEDVVRIIDIQDTEMEAVGEIAVSLSSAADRVVEMYVGENSLNLIVEREVSELETEAAEEEEPTAYVSEDGVIAVCDVYYVDTDEKTELLTYDIRDCKNPLLKGSVTQDGSYKTSRKVGDIVYLFTEETVELPNLEKSEAIAESNVESWIPLVNGTAIAADCIYLPEKGAQGLIVSSVNVEKPDEVVDNTLIMNDFVNIYVGTEAIYLYNTDYENSKVSTQIAKFKFADGVIDAVGATSAEGEVYDTFAINEYQGKLRLLTTDRSGSEEENNLYLFDDKLNLTGSLKGIAKGEQIYAARYLGDMVYFVTYRNTDPLFAVDLSDEINPKILSELKITGFSEYLHFWGDDKLIGIGYETDPDTGAQEGIKLSMFDISEPAKLTTIGSCILENQDYSPALYDYKCVLVDANENLIGFASEAYGKNGGNCYFLFSWKDGNFDALLLESLDEEMSLDKYRGIYVEDTFYLVSTEGVISYDRTEEYQKMQTLEW